MDGACQAWGFSNRAQVPMSAFDSLQSRQRLSMCWDKHSETSTFNVYGCQNTSISLLLSCLMAKMMPDRMQLNNVVDEVKGHFQTAVRVISTSTFKQIESISA